MESYESIATRSMSWLVVRDFTEPEIDIFQVQNRLGLDASCVPLSIVCSIASTKNMVICSSHIGWHSHDALQLWSPRTFPDNAAQYRDQRGRLDIRRTQHGKHQINMQVPVHAHDLTDIELGCLRGALQHIDQYTISHDMHC